MFVTDEYKPRFERPPKFPESPEDYRPGGRCPVLLDQIFSDRYRVIRKLGWGTRATVWLARDNQFVALKICTAASAGPNTEVQLLQKLSNNESAHARAHTQLLLDPFDHSSVNGIHQVLVLDPLGWTLGKFIEHEDSFETFADAPRSAFVREVCRQLVMGLSDIHACGIVHRDLQQGNVLSAVHHDLDLVAESALEQRTTSRDDIIQVQRLDRRALEEGVAPYVVQPWPIKDELSLQMSLDRLPLVIVDFDAASTFENVNDGKHAFPDSMRPPELVLGIPMLAPEADIWSLGCLIFEVVAFRALFHIDLWDAPPKRQDSDYLQNITEVLGPLPAAFLSAWEGRADVVDDNGHPRPHVVAAGISESLEELVAKFNPRDMSESESRDFLSFLRCMLQVEPEARMKAHDSLNHPWLRDHL